MIMKKQGILFKFTPHRSSEFFRKSTSMQEMSKFEKITLKNKKVSGNVFYKISK